jgi:hypothetical protein
LRNVDVVSLRLGQLGELSTKLAQVKAGDLLIEALGQGVDTNLVALGPERDLSQGLVGERVAHDEAGVTSGAAEVDQSALSQEDDLVAVGESVQVDLQIHEVGRTERSRLDIEWRHQNKTK